MSKRRMGATLPATALIGMSLLAAGCAAATSASPSAPGAGATSAAASGGSSGSPGASAAPGNPGPGGIAPVPTSTSSTAPVPGQAACANWPGTARKGPLPLAFQPASVLRCVTGTTTINGKGTYESATLERATSGFTPLLAALRAPSGHAQAGTMCPMFAMVPPEFVLVGKDGSTLSPTLPVTGCGQFQQGVVTALNALPWKTVSVRLFPSQGQPAPIPTPTSPAGQQSVTLAPGQVNGIPQYNSNR
jgi:hypothetical protein